MASIKPLGNRILVKRSKAQAMKGGILLPDAPQQKQKEGIVLAVGPGKLDENGKLIMPHVKVGDRVLFSQYSGTEIKIHDEYEIILAEDDILGVFCENLMEFN